MSQKVEGVIMRNLRDTIFYMKTNVLQDFHIRISVPLNKIKLKFTTGRKELEDSLIFLIKISIVYYA